MNWVDYLIIGIIAGSVILGLIRGLTRELFSLIGWAAALWVSIHFSGNFAHLLERFVETPSLRHVLAFALLFIATLLLAALVTYLMVQLVKQSGLSVTDRVVGVAFGLARGVLLVSVVVLLAGMTSLPRDPWWKESKYLHFFEESAHWLSGFLPSDVGGRITIPSST